MEKKKITYKYVNTGHWMARCDHSTNVIELNKREFFRLSPYYQEYIWIHEHVHLLCDEYDENECNNITDKIFVSRAKNDRDKARRLGFLMASADMSDTKSNIAVEAGLAIASLVLSVLTTAGSTAGSIIGRRNSGYYAMSEADREIYVDELLAESYKESLLTDKYSARDIFWGKLSPYIARKKENTFTAWANKNPFVWSLIDSYSTQYRVNFDEVYPKQPEKHPDYQKVQNILDVAGSVALSLAVLMLLIVLYKTKK